VRSRSPSRNFPDWLGWATLGWFLVWAPAYWRTWGPSNFLQLCDIAVILTCVGFWTDSRLLISSQALSSFLIDLVWMLDAVWQLRTGHALLGSTDYLFDARYPLWVRLLSLFHVAMPVLLLWALHRAGYDRRALALQSAIPLAAFIAARFTAPDKNMNFAFSDPFFHRAWGPPPLHVAISVLFMVVVVYLPTHLVLKRFFPIQPGA